MINISDGAATDGDPRPIAAQLQDIRTSDGNLLLFNVNLSGETVTPIEYPNSPAGLPNPYAVGLFEMSSELTPYMLAVARGMDLPVSDRGQRIHVQRRFRQAQRISRCRHPGVAGCRPVAR